MENKQQSKMKILFVWPNKDGFGFKPIGLALLSAIAKSKGCETKLFDTTGIDFGYVTNTEAGESANLFKPIDFSGYNTAKKKVDLKAEFAKVFNEFDPDIVAFSVLSDEYFIAAEITEITRALKKDVTVVWGGKYPTLKPRESLEVYGADYACVSEGLDAWPELIDALTSSGDTTKIPNIWAKVGDKLISNEIRPVQDDIDSLPYLDWSIFDKRQFYKPFDGKVLIAGDHMLNWGCPYKCTYCINHYYHEAYNNRYSMRRYGAKRIVDELVYLKDKYNLELFRFLDEDFLMRTTENLKELAEEYQKRVNLPCVVETNPKTIARGGEKKCRLLKTMNVVSVSIAIETGDMKVRKEILNRPDTKEDILYAFDLMKKLDIRACSFNLMGFPFETRETYWETVKVNKEAGVQYPNMNFFYPFEGTILRDISIKEGMFDPDGKDKNSVYQRDMPPLRVKDLSERQLIEMRNCFVLFVKLPDVYEEFIKRSETLDEIGTILRSKLLEIYNNTVFKNDGWYKDDGKAEEYLSILSEVMAGDTSHAANIVSSEHYREPTLAESSNLAEC